VFDKFVYLTASRMANGFICITNIRCMYMTFINAGNIQEPTLRAVECSFNQGQANEISDMQPFINRWHSQLKD